ncbi:hypothetical protein BGZ58_003938, partial [Dissophora ornata]
MSFTPSSSYSSRSGSSSNPSSNNNSNRGHNNNSNRNYGPRTDSPTVRLSKALSWLLRHNAEAQGIAIRPDGYVKIQDVLGHSRFKGYTLEDVLRAVDTNEKKRFQILESSDGKKEFIRAVQGHSMEKVADLGNEEIADASQVPVVIHGTMLSKWPLISKCKNNFLFCLFEKGHLDKMERWDRFLSFIMQQDARIKANNQENHMADGYQEAVTSLKSELMTKEEEVESLKRQMREMQIQVRREQQLMTSAWHDQRNKGLQDNILSQHKRAAPTSWLGVQRRVFNSQL